MSALLGIFALNLLPVFLVAGVGFGLARFVDARVETVSRVVFYALAPCLVFSMMTGSGMSGIEFARMALFCLLRVLTIGAVGLAAALALRLDAATRSGLLLVVMFSNTGNYGLPVTLFAFGREALSHATAYFVTASVLTYSVGSLVAGTGRETLRGALAGVARVPALYGAAMALIVLATGVSLPTPVGRAVGLMSDAALPVLMLVLGMQLQTAGLPERRGLAALATSLVLVGAPLLSLGLAEVMGLDGAARQAAVVQGAMPSAVMTTILALQFGAAPAFVAGTVLVTTLLSPFSLTLVIAYLQ